ncbi:hypothetical protein ACLESO_53345, partial [Pyxidicoccus sp. 3LG]
AVTVSLSQVRDTGLAALPGGRPSGLPRPGVLPRALASLALAAEHGPAHLLAGVDASAWPWRQAGLGDGRCLETAHVFLVPPPTHGPLPEGACSTHCQRCHGSVMARWTARRWRRGWPARRRMRPPSPSRRW